MLRRVKNLHAGMFRRALDSETQTHGGCFSSGDRNPRLDAEDTAASRVSHFVLDPQIADASGGARDHDRRDRS
jgi:hypothetical protein